ncbi:alpha/beta hydrolase [Actinokineospora sp. HUAS TT18]|uniref:alpha/beta hydrolase n=1 Tax=Actinokineospora sp. HUAS TT18 TaxID=3447451 RepID=UPI003F51FBA3
MIRGWKTPLAGQRTVIAAAVGALAGPAEQGPDPVLLWPNGAPDAVGDEDADKPSIRIYQPDGEPTGTAVVVCPGGGYGALSNHEGQPVAKWLTTFGVTAAVLRYRLGPRYRHPAPLRDVSRAIRYLRAYAGEWGIAANRVGVMGLSAGGHLAATVSTQFDAGEPDSDDQIERESSRPDFSILCYPVISFAADSVHSVSARNLLGEDPDPALLESVSSETRVTKRTPPAFLFHTAEDQAVSVRNCLAYHRALVKQGVPAELHIYQNGPHGVGLASGDPVLATWKERLRDWLRVNGLLGDSERAEVRGTVTLNGEPLRWGSVAFIPEDGRLPSAFTMVSQGEYAFASASAPAVGKYRVVVYNLGTVERPTIGDADCLTQIALCVDIVEGMNMFDLVFTH